LFDTDEPETDMVTVNVSPCVALVGMLTLVMEIVPVAAKARLDKDKTVKNAKTIEIFSFI